MLTNYSSTAPSLIENIGQPIAGRTTKVINFNIHKLTDEELTALAAESNDASADDFQTTHAFSYSSVEIKPFAFNYATIVSAIINARYPRDEMDAIINNHLFDPTDKHEAEWQEMQQWRTMAKRIAHECTD